MNSRLDLYKEVHKGVRKALFDLAMLAGSTEFNHPESLQRLKDQVNLTYNLLETHAHSEDTYVEPLLRQCDSEVADKLTTTHSKLENDISQLKRQLDDFASGQADITSQGQLFYLALTRFIGEYLQHIADEEQILMPLLWKKFDDPTLMEVTTTIRANIPPPVMKNFLSFMIPAMNHQERTLMLTGIKRAAPPEVFDGVCQLSQSVLTVSDWSRLDATVSAGA